MPDEPVPVCPRCHAPLPAGALITTCKPCLDHSYQATLLEREREAWAGLPLDKVDLTHDRALRHIALRVEPARTYCGRDTSEAIKRRERVRPELLPDSVCTDCRNIFLNVQRLAGEARAGKGVST